MKPISLRITGIFLMMLFVNAGFSQSNNYDSISFDGRWRTHMIHLPTGYTTNNKYPIVLAFHGGGPYGYLSIQSQSRLSLKADSAGFIVVYPEGVKVLGNRTWNADGCCAPSTTLKVNDVGYVNALLNYLFKSNSIDTTRVYATGFSNGALLCYRLANELTSRFAAIAPVAGDLLNYPWNPSRAIPIISFHSYQDQNIKYFGGITRGTTGTYFPPQDSIFNIISKNYSCVIFKDTLFHNTNKYDHFKYSNCSCNAVIEQYVSYDGEHSWPGGLSTGSITVSKQFSATYLMWQFFQNFTITCNTAKNINFNNLHFSIYPNPFDSKINLENATGNEYYILMDCLGKPIWQGKNIDKQEFSFLPNGFYLLNINNTIIKLIKE